MINMVSTVVVLDELAGKGGSLAWDSMTTLRGHEEATHTWSLGLESVSNNDCRHPLHSLTQAVDSEHSAEEGSD
jgi:hypothetical protein